MAGNRSSHGHRHRPGTLQTLVEPVESLARQTVLETMPCSERNSPVKPVSSCQIIKTRPWKQCPGKPPPPPPPVTFVTSPVSIQTPRHCTLPCSLSLSHRAMWADWQTNLVRGPHPGDTGGRGLADMPKVRTTQRHRMNTVPMLDVS